MKKLTKVISKKNFNFGPSWEIVYQWEEAISKYFQIPVSYDTKLDLIKQNLIDKFKLHKIYNLFCNKNRLNFKFIMTVSVNENKLLNRNTIPYIIDFWLSDSEFEAFFETYKNVPFIIVSSLEVYDKLKNNIYNKKIYHCPLSIPDKRILVSNILSEKKNNLVLIGRTNPYFLRLLDRYCSENPDFEYVLGKGDIKNRYFETNKGKYLGDGKDMESYYKMINSAKIAFYSTPGCDEAKHEANGYNQVTPRFLELISGGCFIIAHYTDNPDTRYYQLGEICQDTKNYAEFETQMNYYLKSDVKPDPEKYGNYLSQHVTSNRMLTLKQIFNSEGINC